MKAIVIGGVIGLVGVATLTVGAVAQSNPTTTTDPATAIAAQIASLEDCVSSCLADNNIAIPSAGTQVATFCASRWGVCLQFVDPMIDHVGIRIRGQCTGSIIPFMFFENADVASKAIIDICNKKGSGSGGSTNSAVTTTDSAASSMPPQPGSQTDVQEAPTDVQSTVPVASPPGSSIMTTTTARITSVSIAKTLPVVPTNSVSTNTGSGNSAGPKSDGSSAMPESIFSSLLTFFIILLL